MPLATVFGGSGFLGSHVVEKLIKNNYKVRVFDKSSFPKDIIVSQVISGDILDSKAVDNAVNESDVVYNFAGLSDLNLGLESPLETIELNILGNTNILEACRKYNTKRFIYASTVYVYSKEGGFYRCSKQASEWYVEEYQKMYGLNYTILRYGSLYGPRSNESNGLYQIVKSALTQGKITYHGSPEALREYIHVGDAANSSVAVLDEKFKNQSVILTGQETMRVIDILEMLSEILSFKFSVEVIESDHAGHYIRTPYSHQPKLGVKYVPPAHVDLGQGLLQLIDEVKNDLEL